MSCLTVAVNETVKLEIIIILPEGIDESLSDLQPTKEEGELNCEEEWIEHVEPNPGVPHGHVVGHLVSLLIGRIDPLSANKSRGEVEVDGQGDSLSVH